jgi:PAS domain S-box-containing protein
MTDDRQRKTDDWARNPKLGSTRSQRVLSGGSPDSPFQPLRRPGLPDPGSPSPAGSRAGKGLGGPPKPTREPRALPISTSEVGLNTPVKDRGMNRRPNLSATAAELRRHAEARLRKRQRDQRSEVRELRSAADTQRLLHELQVHQVELEMQNEELSRAKARAEACAAKFSDLHDFAPIGYVSLDDGGCIQELNFTAAKLLGRPRAELVGTALVKTVARRDRDIFLRHLKTASETEAQVTEEVDLASEDGPTVPVQFSTICLQRKSAQARQYRTAITDISARKNAERSRNLLAGILERLSTDGELRPSCRAILEKIRVFAGIEAAAIRLRQGEDFPYFEQIGFPTDFIQAESSSRSRDRSGEVARSEQGQPTLECMCATLLRQQSGSAKPFFSEGGSFWTDSTTELLASTTKADRQGHPRNNCGRAGYESVALIPLRSGGEFIGLLQLSDRHRGRFTPEVIRVYEELGLSIGVALSRQRAVSALKERTKDLSCLYGISALLELPGISVDKLLKGTVRLLPSAWQFPETTVARIVLEGQTFQTARFRETSWMLSRQIIVQGKTVGTIEVCYLEERPASDEGPFLKEERQLLDSIAERLGRNIGRMRAAGALQESEEWCRSFFEHSSDGLLCLSPNGEIVTLNQSFARMHGYSVEDMLKIDLKNLDTPGTSQLVPERMRLILAGNRSTFELEHYHKDGHRVPLEVTVSMIKVGGRKYVLASHRDITKRKQAEKSFHEAHRRTVAVLESITDGFFSLDRDFQLTYVNRAAEKLLGKTRQELIGRNLWQVFPEALGSRFQREYERALAENETVHFEEFYPPFHQWFEVHAYPSAIGLSVYFQDISGRKRAEEAIRQLNLELEERVRQRTATIRTLATDLTLAEQREKSRLARVLHEHLQQLLMGAKYLLTDAQQNFTGQDRETLGKVDQILAESVEVARTLSVELSPPILRNEGLAAALKWLGHWMREKHGLAVKVTAGSTAAPASEEMLILLYQAVRELLFNVVKHAEVRSASVAMQWRDGQVRIVVSDQGKGFDPACLQTTGSRGGTFGLFSVRERLALLGGQMEIESAPGRGSRFTLRVPRAQPLKRKTRGKTKGLS